MYRYICNNIEYSNEEIMVIILFSSYYRIIYINLKKLLVFEKQQYWVSQTRVSYNDIAFAIFFCLYPPRIVEKIIQFSTLRVFFDRLLYLFDAFKGQN